jgi:amino acid transporter
MFRKLKNLVIGRAINPHDTGVFHKMSLVAFFAWVGLGADGLSSSCYGPEEAFLALGAHPHLAVFVALATVLTVFIISASYSLIIEVFPSGGGGYVVASKLLSPNTGMVCGCALLIDYLLTVTISVASGTDALFSFLPLDWQHYKLHFAVAGVIGLTVLNMRGAKETIIPLVPVFLTFIFTHLFIIVYSIVTHLWDFPQLVTHINMDIQSTQSEMGFWGMVFLILRAYSLGAGTYTGIEAVSNGMYILREPKVKTGKRTMLYMSTSLAFTVMGLMLAYLLYGVSSQPGKTLNASLFNTISNDWGIAGYIFVLISLISEALLLYVAAQTGFLGGPKVLASMSLDRWFPTKFAALSDRLVNQKGIFLMGLAAMLTMIGTQGSVKFLVVLYSINVFITFCLSQLGMVRHWLQEKGTNPQWFKKFLINGTGFLVTSFILVTVTIVKFHEGGWITLLMTTALAVFAIAIKRHYLATAKQLKRLNPLVQGIINASVNQPAVPGPSEPDPKAKTAVLVVNGFNGLGLHTLFNVVRLFGGQFRNYVFVQIGVIDAGNFKGQNEVDALEKKIVNENQRYVDYMRKEGFYAESVTTTGIDVIGEVEKISLDIMKRFPGVVFFGGQVVFEKETFFTKWLHNYTVFALQRRLYNHGIPFVVMPIRV